jgi:hypothetical protein
MARMVTFGSTSYGYIHLSQHEEVFVWKPSSASDF